ncbi:hypothetical protein QAD02_004645 [Eretmocerus hayati]|uniref:Uncharacterized protein n=1 Tax=Eretmocerus hayati TaxID=131215 RepID=A0ACC2NRC4_9HYME|nr:hypothetical protein QAD02_004645 [Eretmocerus hayati]
MRLTQILFKQHIGRMTRKNWYAHGKVTPMPSTAEENLKKEGIEIIDPKTLWQPDKKNFLDQFEFLKKREPPRDENHPDWKERPCTMFRDHELLVEGLPQAQQLTKTVVFQNTLPESIESISSQKLTEDQDKLVQRIVETSTIFDAHQEKLPKIKDPNRPAFVFPRQYGITNFRKIYNLSKKFVNLCDCICGPEIANSRTLIEDALLCLPFEKEFDLYEFWMTMDLALMAPDILKPMGQVSEDICKSMTLPDLHPLHYSLGLQQDHFYNSENLNPLASGYNKKNLHTIFAFYDETKIKNLTELEVTESQIEAHGLMKAFTAAASSARQRFGHDVRQLPKPFTVQCIQSDGKRFNFLVYQLNTLDLEGNEGIKNFCWMLPRIDLYEAAGYVGGKPLLEGYNPEVFNRILGFYKNS